MAVAGPTRGCKGVVKIRTAGSATAVVAVGSLRNWSIDESSEEIDTSVMGACTKSFVAGAKKTQLRLDTLWDGDDAMQALLAVGSAIEVSIYPEGTASTSNFYKTPSAGGTVISHNIDGGGVDGVVSASFVLSVNGAMTATTVP